MHDTLAAENPWLHDPLCNTQVTEAEHKSQELVQAISLAFLETHRQLRIRDKGMIHRKPVGFENVHACQQDGFHSWTTLELVAVHTLPPDAHQRCGAPLQAIYLRS